MDNNVSCSVGQSINQSINRKTDPVSSRKKLPVSTHDSTKHQNKETIHRKIHQTKLKLNTSLIQWCTTTKRGGYMIIYPVCYNKVRDTKGRRGLEWKVLSPEPTRGLGERCKLSAQSEANNEFWCIWSLKSRSDVVFLMLFWHIFAYILFIYDIWEEYVLTKTARFVCSIYLHIPPIQHCA